MAITGLSPAIIEQLIKTELERKGAARLAPDLLYKHGFDKSALFLLRLRWDNLFEPWLSKFEQADCARWYRCKGCNRKVKRTGRQSHFNWHKEELLALTTVDSSGM